MDHAPERYSYRRSLALLSRYLRAEWPRVLLLSALLLSGISLQLVQPLILRDFIDLATGAIGATRVLGVGTLNGAAGLFLAVAVANQLLRAGATYVTQDVRWRTTNALRADLARHALALDLGYHNARTPGELIARIDGDVNTLSNFLSQFIIQIVGNGLLIAGVIGVLFAQEARIGLGFLLFVIVTAAILRRVMRLALPALEQFFVMAAELFGFIEERLAGVEDITANGGGAYTMLRFHQTLRKQFTVELRGWKLIMLTFTTTAGMFSIGTALGLGLGGWLFVNGAITIGTVYLIVNYAAMLQDPLRLLTQQLQDLQQAVAGAARIGELYHTQTQVAPNRDSAERLSAAAHAVTFAAADFHYTADTPVLRDVSFHLPAGQVLGLLGRTGSGKTTCTRLLFRLYDITGGDISLDGTPIRDLPLDHLRRRVGIVTQDVQLFNATVRDNLTFFDDTIDDATLLAAIADLGLQPWLDALPAGLDTVLDAGGRGLSAGEGQLLAFTRVFLKDPGLVILDEASSRLDPATEALIERAVGKLLAGRSGIIIAHRLATVHRADRIVILDGGRVLEAGPRAALAADPASHFARLLATGLEEVLA